MTLLYDSAQEYDVFYTYDGSAVVIHGAATVRMVTTGTVQSASALAPVTIATTGVTPVTTAKVN